MEKKHKGIFFELDYGKDIKLDKKDKQILSIIGENCRTQSKQIGEIVNLGKDSVRYRIKNLIKEDLYRGNLTIINPFAFRLQPIILLIKLEKTTQEKEEKILDYFEEHKFVLWFGQTQGKHDFNVILLSKSIEHQDKLIKEIRTKLKENLKEIETLNVTNFFACNTFPKQIRNELKTEIKFDKLDSSFGKLLNKYPYCSSQEIPFNADAKDLIILNRLAQGAEKQIQEISEKTKIPSDTIKNRIKIMIEKNVILAFRASINVSYLGFHGYIVNFKLLPQTTDKQKKKFEEYFKKQEFISFGIGLIRSIHDYQTYLFAKNPLEFNDIIKKIRNEFSDIIEDYETNLILKDYKFTFLPEGIQN